MNRLTTTLREQIKTPAQLNYRLMRRSVIM